MSRYCLRFFVLLLLGLSTASAQGQDLRARVLDTLDNQSSQLLDVASVASRDPRRSRRNRTRDGVDWQLDAAERGALGLHADLAGRRDLH